MVPERTAAAIARPLRPAARSWARWKTCPALRSRIPFMPTHHEHCAAPSGAADVELWILCPIHRLWMTGSPRPPHLPAVQHTMQEQGSEVDQHASAGVSLLVPPSRDAPHPPVHNAGSQVARDRRRRASPARNAGGEAGSGRPPFPNPANCAVGAGSGRTGGRAQPEAGHLGGPHGPAIRTGRATGGDRENDRGRPGATGRATGSDRERDPLPLPTLRFCYGNPVGISARRGRSIHS